MKKMVAAFVACVVVFGAVTACAKKDNEAEQKRIQDSIRVADSMAAVAAAEAAAAAAATAAPVDSAAAAAAATTPAATPAN